MEKHELVTNETEVNIEEIMQQIRAELRSRQVTQLAEQGIALPVGGRRLPEAFYEHLYEAGQAYNQIEAHLHVSSAPIPLIGPVIQWLRRKFHELVLFYVNQVALQQIKVNTHLLRAMAILSEEMDRMPRPVDERHAANEAGAADAAGSDLTKE